MVGTAISSCGTAGTIGTSGTGVDGLGVAGFASARSLSLFFSSFLRKALTVKRSALLGLQSSRVSGLCAQTGQEVGRVASPTEGQSRLRESRVPESDKSRRLIDRSREGERR